MMTTRKSGMANFLDEELLIDHRGHVVTDAQRLEAFKNLGILHDALDLIVELWPKPGYSTVQLESHQWIKLRRVLLEIPRLVAADE